MDGQHMSSKVKTNSKRVVSEGYRISSTHIRGYEFLSDVGRPWRATEGRRDGSWLDEARRGTGKRGPWGEPQLDVNNYIYIDIIPMRRANLLVSKELRRYGRNDVPSVGCKQLRVKGTGRASFAWTHSHLLTYTGLYRPNSRDRLIF